MSNGFIERWSRRKLSQGREPEIEVDPAPEAAPPADDAPVEETLDEAELACLPSLDDFTIETDLAPFLRKGVPHALRNAAMRKMWMLDPAIRDHKDLAVDYAWDWNTPGGVPGNSGSISRDSVARMIDSLNPKPKVQATAQSVPPAPAAKAAEETAAEAPDEGEATACAEPAAPKLDSAVADAPEASRTDTPMSRPRRHGGAAPV